MRISGIASPSFGKVRRSAAELAIWKAQNDMNELNAIKSEVEGQADNYLYDVGVYRYRFGCDYESYCFALCKHGDDTNWRWISDDFGSICSKANDCHDLDVKSGISDKIPRIIDEIYSMCTDDIKDK